MFRTSPKCFPALFALRVARCLLLTCVVLIAHDSLRITAFAQSSSATLSGTVVDQNGAVLPSAEVTIINTATGLQRKATTNDEGYFTMPLLPPSTYSVRALHTGFSPIEIPNVVLNVGDQKALQIQLKAGDINAAVTVVEGGPLLNTESAAVSTVVDRQFVENMPLNGRSFQTLIMLTPGVVLTPATLSDQGQFSVNGQRADANYFAVDGASANIAASIGSPLQTFGGAVPSTTVQGGTNSLVSVDAMQEFRIQTSSFAPEFGRTPGGQVSIVTRSGANKFHGSLFDYLRNDVLDANNWFANRAGQKRPPERQNDFGGVFGGPIIKGRTFFFFSYEGIRLRLPLSVVTVVPSTASANPSLNRQAAVVGVQPFLNVFPIPNGPDLGNGFAQFNASYSDPSTVNATSIRIDHAINSNLTLFGRYNYAPSESVVRQGVASNIEPIQVNTQTFTLGLTQGLSAQVSNEVRANYSNSRSVVRFAFDNFGGAVPLSASTESAVFPSGFSSANSLLSFIISGASNFFVGKNLTNEQRQLNFVDNVSVTHNTHQLKFGVDYRWLAPFSSPRPYSQFAFFLGMTGGAGALGGVPLAAGASSSQSSALLARNFSVYGQDTWKVTPHLTLTYGLRWDINPALKGKNSANEPFVVRGTDHPATMTLAPRGTPLYATTYGNVAPRVGLVYQLRRNQDVETLLRGGFGIFYDLGTGQLGNVTGNWPGQQSTPFFTNVPFPLTPEQKAVPAFSEIPPVTGNFFTADPNLRLPRTYEWNVAMEQSFSASQAVTLTYVGALGRELLRNDTLVAPNATFLGTIFLTKNTGTSDYHALQVQFTRRLSRGLQVLASYTWSHSIDTASSDAANSLLASTISNVRVDRGDSDFDVRHSFSSALTYDLPVPGKQKVMRWILGGWSVDNLIIARSAPPVNVTGPTFIVGQTQFQSRPNFVPGIPLYLYGSQYAGGKIINNTPNQGGPGCKGPFCTPPTGMEGSLGRNALRGFGAWQTNFAVRRQFHITEHTSLQLRAEFFNLTNHPNFGSPTASLASPLFGQSTQMLSTSLGSGGATGGFSPLYQIGGPRSIQLAMKLIF